MTWREECHNNTVRDQAAGIEYLVAFSLGALAVLFSGYLAVTISLAYIIAILAYNIGRNR